MRHFLISAATVTAFAALLAAPASAVENYGPTKVGNQCMTAGHSHGRDLGFAIWGACPQTASVAAAPAHRRTHHR